MSALPVKRTYSSRDRKSFKSEVYPPSSPSSTLASSPPATPTIFRPSKLYIENEDDALPPRKRLKPLIKSTTVKTKLKSTSKVKKTTTQKVLTQLHFNIDQSILRTCSLCDLSYTKGAPADEALHRTHCSRVRQGMEWGREEEKDRVKNGETVVLEVASSVNLKNKHKRGRIICLPANIGGKPGAKLATLLQTINLSLSAPDLPQSVLNSSKAYLFLIPHEIQPHRERIVGCVLAQRIETAMAIVPSPSSDQPKNSDATLAGHASPPPVLVDTDTNLCCCPTPLPTPMGVSRLFVSSSHRRLGIACALLDAAAATFIYGCPLDPRKGQVAFSQPTGMGQAVMKSWGSTRVYGE